MADTLVAALSPRIPDGVAQLGLAHSRLRQLVLEPVLVGAVRAAVEMGAHMPVGLGREPALLIVEQHEEDVVAIHGLVRAPNPGASGGARRARVRGAI